MKMSAEFDALMDSLSQTEEQQQWTDQELVDWLKGQPEFRREKVCEALRYARSHNMDMFRILRKLRGRVASQEAATTGMRGVVGYLLEAIEGYTIGSMMADGPAAMRNLANLHKLKK
jgi:hypothetical protein